LDGTQNGGAQHDSACTTADKDYVNIIGSSLTCQSNNLVNRYCADKFNPFTGATNDAVVCDCSAPFIVGIHTGSSEDAATEQTATTNQGVCLNYVQVPCGAIN